VILIIILLPRFMGGVPRIKEPYMDIGKRIRELREEQGLRQEDLAQRAGVARNTIARIERDELVPSVAMVEKVANGLGVELGALFQDPLGVA